MYSLGSSSDLSASYYQGNFLLVCPQCRGLQPLPTVLHSCNSEYSIFYSTIIRFITNRQASVTFVTPVPGRHRFQVAQIALRCLANT